MPATRRVTPTHTNRYECQGPPRSPAVANPSRVMKRRTINAAMAGVNITDARRAVDLGVSVVNRTPQASATPSAVQASPNASARKVRTARQSTGKDVRILELFRVSVTSGTATRRRKSLRPTQNISSTICNYVACRLLSLKRLLCVLVAKVANDSAD